MHEIENITTKLEEFFPQLVGESFEMATDDNGDVFAQLFVNGELVHLKTERLASGEPVVMVYHVVGTAIEDQADALHFTVELNAKYRFGRWDFDGDSICLTDWIWAGGLTKDALRHSLRMVAEGSRMYGELSARTGALRLVDALALGAVGESDEDDE